MKYQKLDIGPCVSTNSPCQHRIKALSSDADPETPVENWEDLGVKDVLDIIPLLLANNLHTTAQPHPLWPHFSESKKTFIAPNRSYKPKPDDQKKRKIPRSERLRLEREQKTAQESKPSEATKHAASKSPPRKKQKTEQSQYRYQPRRAGAKNKKKKKRSNSTNRIGRLDIQQVVAKGKTGNVPKDLGELRFNGLAGRYVPPRFPAVTMNIFEPQCTVTQHITGQLGITGAASEYVANVCHALYERFLADRSNKYMDMSCFRVVNFTTRGYIGLPIDLAQFKADFENLPDFSVNYEPSSIESVQVKPMQKTLTDGSSTTSVHFAANLFYTGNICVVGFRDKETIKKCEETFMKAVRQWAELQQALKNKSSET